jgi:hypothetical protein
MPLELALLLRRHEHNNNDNKNNGVVVSVSDNNPVVVEDLHKSSTSCHDHHDGVDINILVQPFKNHTEYRPWETTESKGRKIINPLGYIHIPKTGGSSILTAARMHNISWGPVIFKGFPRPKFRKQLWQHTPIQYLPSSNPKNNPYQGQDLFAVIRNPYTRTISEHFYMCKYSKSEKRLPGCKDAQGPKKALVINQSIQEKLKIQLSAEKDSNDYYMRWGHRIPQYDFLFDSKGNRMVDYILHQETLNDEFQSLMHAYDLPLQLSSIEYGRPRPALGLDFGISNLTIDTIRLIETAYDQDFLIGGYVKLSKQAAQPWCGVSF